MGLKPQPLRAGGLFRQPHDGSAGTVKTTLASPA